MSTESNQKLSCIWVEHRVSISNYQGKILGAIGYLLVMKVVLSNLRKSEVNVLTLSKDTALCDNMGVVKHRNCSKRLLPEK